MVHGLFGHPKKTWSINTSSNASTREPADGDLPSDTSDEAETENRPRKKRFTRGRDVPQDVFWPRDLLPREFPQARIVTWGYDVQIDDLSGATSKASILHHSESLLADLVMLRESDTAKLKPLIFIAHSLGGIVVKDALSLSGSERTVLNAILPATIGVMFLGTPHHGSRAASLGKMMFEISKIFFKKPNLQVLRGLENNSEILERISRSFGQILSIGRIDVHSFREELPTHGVMVVGSASSTIGYPHETRGSLHANHRNMARFSSTKDIKFQRVVSVLQGWVKKSLEKQHNQQHLQFIEETLALPDGLAFDKELEQCLTSLHSHEAQNRFEDIEPAYYKTYNWLFDHQVGFEDWLEGKNSSNIYWIQGKPGSGKSTVMKFAINHHLTRELLSKYTDNFWVVSGFFFHDRGTTAQKSAEGFLREVLYQIIHHQKHLFVLIYPIFARIFEQNVQSTNSSKPLADGWTLSVLRDALELIGRKSTNEVNICLFVDALDEHDGNHRELVLILKSIAELTANPAFRVRLALAGRPENVFKTAFQSSPGFSVHEYTTDDIRHYAEDRIQADIPRELSIEYEEGLRNLVENIVRKAQGVFLWVRLVVSEIVVGICEGDTMEELMNLLSTIPTELGDLYKRALHRSSRGSLEALTRNRSEAYVMFQIATCAREPFLLHEFLAATHLLTTERGTFSNLERLSEEQLERRLNSRSAGLLEVSRGSKRPVQFIHQTVKEFMTVGDGKTVIREGLSDQQSESGFGLIFRYILKLLENFTASMDLKTQNFVTKNFVYYANILEWSEEQCVADSFEPIILGLPKKLPYDILNLICAKSYFTAPAIIPECRNRRMRFCLFYLHYNLPLSLKKSLATYKARMTLEDSHTLLQATAWLKRQPRGSAQILQILTEEGVVARLLEVDSSQRTKAVNDILSEIRNELPERKKSSSFPTPNEEGSGGKREGEGSNGEWSEGEGSEVEGSKGEVSEGEGSKGEGHKGEASEGEDCEGERGIKWSVGELEQE